MTLKLDYSLESPEQRKELVEKILSEGENFSSQYLEILSNYLILCMEKQEKKQKKLLTENRMVTINKREASFEGLASQLENGEDGIYNLMRENDKSVLFQPKISITKDDLREVPFLAQLRSTIDDWDQALKSASGKTAYAIKKALIEMRKDQYVIKQAYRRPIVFNHVLHSAQPIRIFEDLSEVVNGELRIAGISFADPTIVSIILQNYSKLREDGYGKFIDDTYYLIEDFDNVAEKALSKYPVYQKIIQDKIDGLTNLQIQKNLQTEFNISYSLEYISSLWRKKIPKLIAGTAANDILEREYRKQKLPLKKCSRCGTLKPAHNNFFSKNKTSKDGFYSVCKVCRNKKKGE